MLAGVGGYVVRLGDEVSDDVSAVVVVRGMP